MRAALNWDALSLFLQKVLVGAGAHPRFVREEIQLYVAGAKLSQELGLRIEYQRGQVRVAARAGRSYNRGVRPRGAMKILLAIDDSVFSQAAIKAVIEQIRPEHDEVLVLTVVDLLNYFNTEKNAEASFPNIEQIRLARLAEASRLVEQAAASLRAAGFETTVGVSEGDPKFRIIETAENWNAGLIVVGSHGQKPFERALLGSVSDAVVHHAPCSVTVIRNNSPH
jgi:nucleotide-binding universal stress UspA family protein